MQWLVLALLMLSPNVQSAVIIKSNNTQISYDFNIDKLAQTNQIIEGENFDVVNLIGVDGYEGIEYIIGNPQIPIISFFVLAEKKSDIKIEVLTIENTQNIVTADNLRPVLAPVAKIAGARYHIVKNKMYQEDRDYPLKKFEIIQHGQIRGKKQFLVKLYPVVFNSKKGQVSHKYNFKVNVNSVQRESKNATVTSLYLVGEKFKNSVHLNEYIATKTALGEKVIRREIRPNQTALEIRNIVKQVYSNNPNLTHVLIFGDADDVTGYPSAIIAGTTDHYYAAIDTNDYTSDIATPDLFVGRVAIDNELQLKAVLNKHTRYLRPTLYTFKQISELSFLATDDRYEVAEGTHNFVIDNFTKNRGYSGNYPSRGQAGGDKLYAITYRAGNSEVMNSISKGRSIIDYSGHGAYTYWDAPRVEQSDVLSLRNSLSPFVISNACITGDFRTDESFAETWQRHEFGSIAFWGSMDSTFWDEDDILEKKMFEGIFRHDKKKFGEITRFALREMDRHYAGAGYSKYYWETYHLFGDASIDLKLNSNQIVY